MSANPLSNLSNLSPDLPIIIAGPTASGKSTLALDLAARDGGVIVNADALQVFANWRLLTARPSDADLAAATHHLYGHIARDAAYSVGHWLRDVTDLLNNGKRPIIVGGTGLYFTALTTGLADIPPTPVDIRRLADEMLATSGLTALIADLDPATLARIDQQNPVRVQRAWEVQRSTGRTLADWQDDTPPPVLPLNQAQPILLSADKSILNDRIERRFDAMLANGVLDEARDNQNGWSPAHPSAKAIGATQLIAHLNGDMNMEQLRESVTQATRQYAKRQRSWFRARMTQWRCINVA